MLELNEIIRFAKDAGHYQVVEVINRCLRMSPRAVAELRRKWAEQDRKAKK